MYVLLIAAAFAFLTGALTRAYRRNWTKKLDITLGFTSDGIYEGEKGEIVETMSNRKLMPVFWANLQFYSPAQFKFEDFESDHNFFRQDLFTVMSYEEVVKRLQFSAAKRGYYRIGEASVQSGDLLFKYKLIHKFSCPCDLYVYPKRMDTSCYNIDFKQIIGDVIAHRNLVEDPYFFRGIRDYFPFDDMKAVNWNATARTGSLKVNEYHSTNSQQVLLLLDFDGYGRWDKEQCKEDVIRIAAGLASMLIKNGVPVGVCANALDSVSGKRIETACKNGSRHYMNILRELSKLDTEKVAPFCNIADGVIKNDASSEQIILISYYSGPDLQQFVSAAKASGTGIQWILVKDKSRAADFEKKRGMYVCEVEY